MAGRAAAVAPNDAWETISGGDEWETVSGQQPTPPMPPSVASRIGRQALSTIGGGLKAPFSVAGSAIKSVTSGSPRPLYDAVVAPQVEQFKKAGGQLQRAVSGDLSGIPGAVMYSAAGLLPGFGSLITSAVEQGTPVERGGEGDVPKAVGTLAGGAALAAVPKVASKVLPKVVPHVTKMGGAELAPTPAEGVTAMISPKGAAMHYGARQLSRLFKKPKVEEPASVSSRKGTGTKYGGPTDPGYSPPGTIIPRRGLPDLPPRPVGKGTRTQYGGPADPGYSPPGKPIPRRGFTPPDAETAMPTAPGKGTGTPYKGKKATLTSQLEESIAQARGNIVKKVVNTLKSHGIDRDLAERATAAQRKDFARQAGVSHISDLAWDQILDELSGKSWPSKGTR